MTAEEFLKRYEKIDAIIKNKEEKIQGLDDKAKGTTSHLTPDKVQTSGNGQKMANSVDEALDLMSELKPLKIKRIQVRREIETVIEQLPVLRYKILYRKYILLKAPKVIAYEVDRSKDTVNRQTRIAIEEVQGILDKNSENILQIIQNNSK